MLNKQVMIDIFTKLLFQSKKSYDEFNTADGQIGDGDLGITILNGLEEINNNTHKFKDDLSVNFMICSKAFVKKSGSSFGTLIAFAFMNISKYLIGKNSCDQDDVKDIIDIAMETIQQRGKTKIGDKTNFPLNSMRLKKLTESYVVSNKKIVNQIGKSLPISSEQGMLKTFNSFKLFK